MDNSIELINLFRKGRLGAFPISVLRVRAGLRLMNDYRMSIFMPKMTRDYSDFVIKGRSFPSFGASESRVDAADRYLAAVKAVGKYEVYLIHFLRDEGTVRSFLLKNPLLNKGRKTTYKSIYKALCDMLDLLAAHYDAAERDEAS